MKQCTGRLSIHMWYGICIVLLIALVSAHGNSLTKQDQGRTIEFSIPAETITARSSGTFTLSLEDEKGTRLPNVNTFIRVSHGDTIIFASSQLVTDNFGSVPLTLYFKKSGTYQIDATFQQEEKIKASFDIDIAGKPNPSYLWKKAIIAIILIAGGIWLYQYKKPNKGKAKSKKTKFTQKLTQHILYGIAIILLIAFILQGLKTNTDLKTELNKYYLRAEAFQSIAGIEKVEAQHVHADWKFYIDNELVELYKKPYLETNRIVHMHEGVNNEWVIHIHNKGITLRHFLTSIGIQLTNECLTVEGKKYCNDRQRAVAVYINGESNNQASDYLLQDNDKILLTYGSQRKAIVEQQLVSIGKNACIQSNNC